MKSIVLLLLLSGSVCGQTPLQTVRIQAPDEKAADQDFGGHLSDALGSLKYIAITSGRHDYDIWIVTSPIKKDDEVIGHSVAVLIITKKTGRFKLISENGPELQGIAARVVKIIKRDVFRQP